MTAMRARHSVDHILHDLRITRIIVIMQVYVNQ